MALPAAAKLLSAAHLMAQPRQVVSAMPSARKLGVKIAEAIGAALFDAGTAPWRVTLERLEDSASLAGEEFGMPVRVESRAGSMTLHLGLDRPAISAICEAVMGGTGSEAPFEFPERALSAIEKDVLKTVLAKLAARIAAVLSEHLGTPARLFEGDPENGMGKPGQDLIAFRFAADVFGYSGEFRLTVPARELAVQFEAAHASAAATQIIAERQADLQREIGKAEVEFTIALGPETLLVEELATLAPGRMVKLAAATGAHVIVSSGGIAVFAATLSNSGGHLAARIVAAAP